ncbi:MAG: DEAD/DEAH box helicase, partial [Pseudomonadota bacterium]
MKDFSRLPGTLSEALSERGYGTLTPVQKSVIDDTFLGKDLLVSAQTGSGKTVGFGLAIASDILDGDGQFGRPAAPLAVIIAPTRELAQQVRREFDWLFAHAGIVTASAVGGMDTRTERRALERGAHVVVATPGRLRDHAARGNVDLGELRAVVLDEADEMLDMGFAEDLEFILDQTPSDRRTLMFSATVPPGIAKLAKTNQKDDAERLVVGNSKAQHADISYNVLNVAPSDIEKAIINVLIYHDAQTAIIFANTRSMVARLTAKFSNRGFKVVSLSGELSQAERGNAMQALRDGRANVCVATDVAARGIDLPGLDLVIHADLPSNSETLLHRSGRTGRAGRKGRSVLIVPGRFRSKAQRLLKTAKLEAEWGAPPSAKDVLAKEEERIISGLTLSEPLSPEESAFAARLLADRTPEQIAAAYLRLYREHHSAPEILGEIPEPGKRPKADRSDFGPSTWFSLFLGRKDRAEPRWLLPMLCRNAGLDKASIGALRVQYQETFVEIASAAVPAMKAELGDGLALEQGAALTELEGTPDFHTSPKGPPPGPSDRTEAHKDRKVQSGKDRPSKDHAAKPNS